MVYKFVTIEGNIGAGKTTLAKLLSEEFGGQIILERFDNPFLSKFYEEPVKYAFQLEMAFLLERYQQLNKFFGTPNIFSRFTVSDYMFNKSLLFAKITLNPEEYTLYRHFFHLIHKKLPDPDIIFYLHADPDALIRNIRKRGRSFEQNISRQYLQKIEKMYFEFFKQMPDQKVVVVNVNDIDWVSDVFAYKELLGLFDVDYKPGINVVDLRAEV
jgi:deoxyguanosine kinase